MVVHSHSQWQTMEASQKPGGTISDNWEKKTRKENKEDPKPTTADKTVSSLLHIERDFQNLQTPTFSFQGKSQFKKFTLFCFHFALWFPVGCFFFFVFLLYNIYNGRLWFLFSDFFCQFLCNWWIKVDTCKYPCTVMFVFIVVNTDYYFTRSTKLIFFWKEFNSTSGLSYNW